MASASAHPATFSVLATGSVTWTNASNAGASDNAYATCNLGALQYSHSLVATNLGFAIPVDATIDGISVTVEGKTSVAFALVISNALLQLSGGDRGSDLEPSSYLPTSDGNVVIGGASQMWGTTWTPAQVNDTTFGVLLIVHNESLGAALASIDDIIITVHYTPAAVAGGAKNRLLMGVG